MASTEPTGAQPSGVQKHRACDECRFRKLACSKEPSGCSRCHREGIRCHYSPQKPMGRPRKRRLVEESTSVNDDVQAPAVESVVVVSSADHPYEGQSATAQHVPPSSSMLFSEDPSLSFLGDAPADPNLGFMDLLPYDHTYLDTSHTTAHLDPQILLQNDGVPDDPMPFALNGVDILSGINFDEEPGSSAAAMSKDLSDSLQRYWLSQGPDSIEPPESMPSDLSNSASDSPGSIAGQTSSSGPASAAPPPTANPTVAPSPKAIPSVSCGCLSTLYLALDSLSHLPTDVTAAIRVARNATKVAHDVIRCPACSEPVAEDVSVPVPIQSFQSLMLLATIVPSTCNAYASILEMVDVEHAAAKREARTLAFSFQDIGGIWGVVRSPSGDTYTDDCPRLTALNNTRMDPDTWRTTMRAILRLDVYGFGEPPDDVPMSAASKFRHSGLRDVVRLLEDRSNRRHERVDHLFAAGKVPEHSGYLLHQPYRPLPPQERQCMRVLEAARVALDNLVIS